MEIPKNHNKALVIFVHGSGSSIHSSRNEHLANVFNRFRISTLMINLLSTGESIIDNRTKDFRFNIQLLTKRLLAITDTMTEDEVGRLFRLGYFGSSTGSAVAIEAAIRRPKIINAIVSRSGRLDLAKGNSLKNIRCPILLIAGSKDLPIIDISYKTMENLRKVAIKKLILIPGASHLFEEPGSIDQVSRVSAVWFKNNL